MLLTPKQTAAFWRLWARAERETLPASATRNERTELRRQTLIKACHCSSLKQVNRTNDYDALMLATATMAGDYQAMSYWCLADERRMLYMIGECARQIGEIQQQPKGWKYCRGIFAQANLPADWLDVPATSLHDVFSMLDTHRRRVLKRDHDWGHGSGPLGFVDSRRYYYTCSGLAFSDVGSTGDDRLYATA